MTSVDYQQQKEVVISDEIGVKLSAFMSHLRLGKMSTTNLPPTAASSSSGEKASDDVLETYDIALKTAQLLRLLISQTKWTNGPELMSLMKREGLRLMSAQPSESTVGNVVKRVLKLYREECSRIISGEEDVNEDEEEEEEEEEDNNTSHKSHQQLLAPRNLKAPLIEAVNELITEIETSSDNIAMQALEHIHSNEIIMTAGHSKTVEKFLKAAAKKRKFQVIVAECAPFYHGHSLARALAEGGIQVTVITDSAVFAIMSRVNKVIVGTHTVLANGGLRALVGSHTIALSAQHYSTPVIVLAPMFKLTPQYLRSHDQDGFNKFISPRAVCADPPGDNVDVYNPVYDYVPPELVTLLISNECGNSTSYMYRLLRELYDPQDYDL